MKRLLTLLLIMVMLVQLPAGGASEAITDEARSYWLYEMNSGLVLAEHQADRSLPMASLTKLMTCLLTLEAIEQGQLAWTETITLPRDYINPGGSSLALKPGETVTVRQLLEGLMIVSANDGARLLALLLQGDEDAFVDSMNLRAKAMGLDDTYFINASGLPGEKGQNSASARDVGKLSIALIDGYGDALLAITGQENLMDSNRSFQKPATNTLMKILPAVDGLKTGHTNAAGYCLAATRPYPGRDEGRLVAVVMGAASETARNQAALALFNWADSAYAYQKVIDSADIHALGSWKGLHNRTVSGHAEASVERLLPRGADIITTIDVTLPDRLPLSRGDRIGTVTAELPDGTQLSVPLISDTEILSVTWGERLLLLFRAVGGWLVGFLPS